MKNFSKNIFIWIIITLILVALFNVFDNTSSGKSGNLITYSEYINILYIFKKFYKNGLIPQKGIKN